MIGLLVSIILLKHVLMILVLMPMSHLAGSIPDFASKQVRKCLVFIVVDEVKWTLIMFNKVEILLQIVPHLRRKLAFLLPFVTNQERLS